MAEKGPLVAVTGEIHGVPLLFKSLLEEPGCFWVILDDENSHLISPPEPPISREANASPDEVQRLYGSFKEP